MGSKIYYILPSHPPHLPPPDSHPASASSESRAGYSSPLPPSTSLQSPADSQSGPADLNLLPNQHKHIEPRNRILGRANLDELAVGLQQLKILLQRHLGTRDSADDNFSLIYTFDWLCIATKPPPD